jgi:hypothetical protein
MRDIFVGICYGLKTAGNALTTSLSVNLSQYSNDNSNPKKKVAKADCLAFNEYTITPFNINFEDELVRSTGNLEVDFIEFAPKIFQSLRKMECLDEDEMINSLLPMKNKSSIKQSQGKSGNFFLCTDDNKFILKTISTDELELIRSVLLKKFTKHMKRYPNSLLCRIYGLYKMILSK